MGVSSMASILSRQQHGDARLARIARPTDGFQRHQVAPVEPLALAVADVKLISDHTGIIAAAPPNGLAHHVDDIPKPAVLVLACDALGYSDIGTPHGTGDGDGESDACLSRNRRD